MNVAEKRLRKLYLSHKTKSWFVPLFFPNENVRAKKKERAKTKHAATSCFHYSHNTTQPHHSET